MYYIYYNGLGEKKGVTYFYMGLIEQAIEKIGGEYKEVFACPNIVTKADTIVTLSCVSFWKAYNKHPKNIINWFQGITPEEYWMRDWKIGKKIAYRIALSYLERFALRHSDFNFFVSERMLTHFRKKYNFRGNNYLIMPCMNEGNLYDNAFNDGKYAKQTFIYTGNINEWQCFDEMVLLFKQIKKNLPSAELNIFTNRQELAHQKLIEYGVDATVDFKPQSQLNEAIKDMKYGFIIRKDIIVNNVASPTKMSTYISNGIIPIFSKCIGDYDARIGKLHYSVPLDNDYGGLDKLYLLEKGEIYASDVKKEYTELFSNYYNSEGYIQKIIEIITNLK